MDVKIILSTQIIGLLIETSISQFYGNQYQQPYQQSYPQQTYQQPSYSQPPYQQSSYTQQLFPQMSPSMQSPIQVHIPQSPPQPLQPSRRDSRSNIKSRYDDYSTDYDYRDETSGSERENLRSRPDEFVEVPNNPVPPGLPPHVAVQPNLVLVPYPYALVIPTSTSPPGTTKKTVSIQTPLLKSNLKNTTFSDLRYRTRKTKPTWLPKYGIVPIPDKLAEKLMSQLREVKGLRAHQGVNMENNNGYPTPLQYRKRA